MHDLNCLIFTAFYVRYYSEEDGICQYLASSDYLRRDHSLSMYVNFQKTAIHYSLIHRRTCAYQSVRNVSFSENFAYVLNE